jgi:hypothetical protein
MGSVEQALSTFSGAPLTRPSGSDCIAPVRLLLLILCAAAAVSCTTVGNRRDLYSPEPGPGSRERSRQLAGSLNGPAQPNKAPATPEETARPEFR